MPYMLAPGARLVVGPGGQLEETLGLGCSSCAPAPTSGLDAITSSRGGMFAAGALTGLALIFMLKHKPRRR